MEGIVYNNGTQADGSCTFLLAAAKMRITFLPPPPTPEFLSKDFCLQPVSRMEILNEENLVGAKTAPTVISRAFTPFLRQTTFPQ